MLNFDLHTTFYLFIFQTNKEEFIEKFATVINLALQVH